MSNDFSCACMPQHSSLSRLRYSGISKCDSDGGGAGGSIKVQAANHAEFTYPSIATVGSASSFVSGPIISLSLKA